MVLGERRRDMKKIILCFSMFLCLILLGFTGKEVTIQLKDIEEVSEIQLNTAKISIQLNF